MDTKPVFGTIDITVDFVIDEIDDFVDENPITKSLPISTIESNIQRMEAMRYTFRSKFRDTDSFKAVMLKIKTYIKDAKSMIDDLRKGENTRVSYANRESFDFEVAEINLSMDEIEYRIRSDVKDSSDGIVEEMKKSAFSSRKILERLSDRMSKLVDKCPAGQLITFQKTKERYETIYKNHTLFERLVQSEFETRELN